MNLCAKATKPNPIAGSITETDNLQVFVTDLKKFEYHHTALLCCAEAQEAASHGQRQTSQATKPLLNSVKLD